MVIVRVGDNHRVGPRYTKSPKSGADKGKAGRHGTEQHPRGTWAAEESVGHQRRLPIGYRQRGDAPERNQNPLRARFTIDGRDIGMFLRRQTRAPVDEVPCGHRGRGQATSTRNGPDHPHRLWLAERRARGGITMSMIVLPAVSVN